MFVTYTKVLFNVTARNYFNPRRPSFYHARRCNSNLFTSNAYIRKETGAMGINIAIFRKWPSKGTWRLFLVAFRGNNIVPFLTAQILVAISGKFRQNVRMSFAPANGNAREVSVILTRCDSNFPYAFRCALVIVRYFNYLIFNGYYVRVKSTRNGTRA